MLTDPVEILEEIIKEDGDCKDISGPAVCKRCPLGNKRINGVRVNCSTYVHNKHNLYGRSLEEIQAIFKTEAENELFTIQLEKALE